MKQTIIQVSDSHSYGGTEQVILQLLGGLHHQWNSVLIHPPLPGDSPLSNGARSLGVEHYDLDLHPGLAGLRELPSIVRLLRALRPAIVHAHLTTPLACRNMLIAAKIARVPGVVATAHLFKRGSRSVSRVRDRLVASSVDRYIVVSRAMMPKLQDYLSIPARKIRLVRNGIVPRSGERNSRLRDELTGGTKARVALVVARLAHHKGHRYLLKAAEQIPEAVFVLAGEGPEREALQRQAQELAISQRVRFLGFRVDIPELLANSDLFVLPSLNEGLPLAVLEAMAAAKPVVATSIGGTDEAVVHGETGLLVPPADASALASAIRTVIQDDDLARRLGAAGLVRVNAEFRAEEMARRVGVIYSELLA